MNGLRTRGRTIRHGVAALALGALSEGCIVYVEPGADLYLTWEFSGSDCAEADVDTVMIELSDEAGTLAARDQVRCAAGRAAYHELPAGRYGVRLEGVDSGRVTYRGERAVTVHGGYNAYHVDLYYVRD